MEKEQRNNGMKPNRKILLVGHVGHGSTVALTAAMIAKIKEQDNIIVVDTSNANEIEKEEPRKQRLGDPEPYIITDRYLPNAIQEPVFLQENNPWPPPKGKKGKRRY